MYFSTAIIAAAAFLSAATASPIEERQTTTTPPDRYYLRTQVEGKAPHCGTNKNDLWVYSYHTGAGLGDVGLSSNKSWAMEGYLNGSQQMFTYPGNEIGPWPLAIQSGAYQQWSVATISIAEGVYPYEGFYFNSSGLQYNESYAGWLACDWWHGEPQLFNYDGYAQVKVPCSCSKVNLLPVAV